MEQCSTKLGPSVEESFVDGITEGRYGGVICVLFVCRKVIISLMVSLAITESAVYFRMLGPGQGAFENLPKSTCHSPEQRSRVARIKTIFYLMMANYSLSNKSTHPTLQIFPMDTSDSVMSWNRYALHTSAKTLGMRMEPSWVLVIVLLSGRTTLIGC